MDFFTVPKLTFDILYCFFVTAHDRRRILHFNVTRHPTSAWVVQQLREAFPYNSAPEYLIFDRGTQFNGEVIDTIKGFDIRHLAFTVTISTTVACQFLILSGMSHPFSLKISSDTEV